MNNLLSKLYVYKSDSLLDKKSNLSIIFLVVKILDKFTNFFNLSEIKLFITLLSFLIFLIINNIEFNNNK